MHSECESGYSIHLTLTHVQACQKKTIAYQQGHVALLRVARNLR